MKLWKMILACILAGTLCLGAAASGVWAEQRSLSGKLIRLHVIGASDSQEDQSAKLLVRDAVLQVLSEQRWQSRDEAEASLRGLLPQLCRVGEDALQQLDSQQSVTAELTYEDYPTRDYGSFRLPAGEYLSLRVMIGEGEGKNWWCVVYPALCLHASVGATAASAGFTAGEVALITEDSPQVMVRFRLLELLQSVARRIKK